MTDIASLQLKIDATQTEKAAKSLDKLTESAAKTEKASENLTKTWSNEQRLINERAKAIMESDKVSDAAIDKAWALSNGYIQVGDALVKSTKDSTSSLSKLGLNTQQVRREMMQLGKEAATGDFSRMPKTFASIATHSNLLPALISPIGIAIGAVTAAAAIGAYTWVKWGESAALATKNAEDGLAKVTAKAAAAQRLTQVQELDKLEAEIKSAEVQATIQSEIGRDTTREKEIRAIAYRAAGQFRILAEGLKKQKSDLEDQMRAETKDLLKDPKQKKEQINSEQEYMISIGKTTEEIIKKAQAIEYENSLIGKTASQITQINNARYDEKIAIKEGEAERLKGISGKEAELFLINEQIKAMYQLKSAGSAKESLTKLAEENKKAAEKSARVWQNFSDNVQNVFSTSLYNGMMGTFGNIEEMFKQMILRMVAEAAAAELMISMKSAGKGLLSMFTSGGTGNPSGGADSAGFATNAAGETLSFAGGGFTGSGSRSGGVDGMGGFPAILHPNETVVDHTKGGSSSANSIVINDNTTINIDSRSDRMQVLKDVQKMIESGHAKLVDNLRREGQLA